MAENLCLRQQLSALQRRSGQPRLGNADRRYPMDLRRGVDRAVEAIVEDLKKNSKKVNLQHVPAGVNRGIHKGRRMSEA